MSNVAQHVAAPSELRLLGLLGLLRGLGFASFAALGGCSGFAGGGLDGLFARTLALLDARRLTGQVTQVVEARLMDATALDHFDLVDVRRVVREDPLDANAVADLANGEGRARALRDAANANAFEG